MTFRDDHDAAIARADALDVEVERERERADAQAREIATLRRERDELEAKVARLEGRPPTSSAESAPGAPSERGIFLMVVVIAVLFSAIVALAAMDGG